MRQLRGSMSGRRSSAGLILPDDKLNIANKKRQDILPLLSLRKSSDLIAHFPDELFGLSQIAVFVKEKRYGADIEINGSVNTGQFAESFTKRGRVFRAFEAFHRQHQMDVFMISMAAAASFTHGDTSFIIRIKHSIKTDFFQPGLAGWFEMW